MSHNPSPPLATKPTIQPAINPLPRPRRTRRDDRDDRCAGSRSGSRGLPPPPVPPRTEGDHARVAADAVRWQQFRDPDARDRVFASVGPLLSQCASRFCPPGADPADLRQELAFAVHDALRNFRPDGGARFSSFLVPWMRKRAREWRDRERLIYIPESALVRSRRAGGPPVPWCDNGLDEPGAGDTGAAAAATAARTALTWAAARESDFAPAVLDRVAFGALMDRLEIGPRDRALLEWVADGEPMTVCAERLGLSRDRAAGRLVRLRRRIGAAWAREFAECGAFGEEVESW